MNPDLLLRIVAALAGFLLKTTLAFGVCLVFSWLARLAKPKVYGLAGISFRRGGVLALAGERRSGRWKQLVCQVLPAPRIQPVDFHRRRRYRFLARGPSRLVSRFV